MANTTPPYIYANVKFKNLGPQKKNNVHGSGLSIFFFSRLENSFNITPFEEKERNNEIYLVSTVIYYDCL